MLWLDEADVVDIEHTIEHWIASGIKPDEVAAALGCAVEGSWPLLRRRMIIWSQRLIVNGGEHAADGLFANIGNRGDESLASQADERFAEIRKPENWSVLAVNTHDRSTRMRDGWLGATELERNGVAARH